jgi:hypothetical protein
MKTNLLAIWLVLLLYGVIPAHAGIIVDQIPPNGNAQNMTDFRVADDFTLFGPYLLDAINFWYFAQDETDLSVATFGIYDNTGGTLGALIDTGTVAPTTSFDSVNDAYFAVLDIGSFDIAAGTYWLELHAGSSFTDDNGNLEVDWAAVDDNSTALALGNTSLGLPDSTALDISGYEQMAFQIDGVEAPNSPPQVPEPASGLLAGSALAGLFAFSARSGRLRSRTGQPQARLSACKGGTGKSDTTRF